jgi:hypothetical protein
MATPEPMEKSPCANSSSPAASQPVAAERAHQRTGDHADAPVPEAIEMGHRFGRGPGIVDVNARDAEARAEFAAVDDRRAARRRRLDQGRRFLGQPVAEKDQAVGFLALQHQGVALFTLGVVLGVAEQHRVAAALGRVFDPLQDLGKERVGDVRNGDDQLPGAEGSKVRRYEVGREAETLDLLQHLLAGFRRDHIRPAEHPGDGGGGNAGALGDFVDRGHPVRRQFYPLADAVAGASRIQLAFATGYIGR